MRNIWILVADAGRARIVSKAEGTDGLAIVQQLNNPLGRAHNVDLVSDQRGSFEKHGSGVKSAMEMRTEPHEEMAREFARKLNHVLEKAASARAYDLLAVVAPPHFLGLLRTGMKPEQQNKLVLCLARDYMHLSHAELQRQLDQVLELPTPAE